MKILFLALDVNLNSDTGDAIHTKELVSNLAALGNEMHVVVSRGKLTENVEEKEHLQSSIIRGSGARPPGHFRTLKYLMALIRTFRPDIIYERRFSGKTGYSLSILTGIPFVQEVNGLAEEEARVMGRRVRSTIWSAAKRRIRTRFFKRTSRIVVVAERIQIELVRQYQIPNEKFVVIPNGANIDLFHPMDMQDCKIKLGLDTKNSYILFVGSMVQWQGVEHILKAVTGVVERTPSSRFLFGGDGPQRRELLEMAKDLGVTAHVEFTGAKPYSMIPTYINAAVVCLSIKPPLIPGSPLKIREYMSCGKPVIATRKSDYDFRIIEEAEAGLLVSPENTQEVVDAVVHILENPSIAEEMGTKARQYAMENCSWAYTARRVLSVLEEAT